MAFVLNDIHTSGVIEIGEVPEDGSFVRNVGESPNVNVKFRIRGANDASTAYSSLITWLETNYSDGNGGIAAYNIPLKNVEISATTSPLIYTAQCTFEEKSDVDGETINATTYQEPAIEESDYSYSTTGGTSHITHGLATISATSTGTALDFNGGIGWDGESFQGVDVVTPRVSFTITVSRPKSAINSTYRRNIANYTGAVNSTAWDGFAARCLLFEGFEAKTTWYSYQDSDNDEQRDYYWRCSYRFSAMPAQTITFNNTSIAKSGYDYLWKYTRKTENSTTGEIQSSVAQINVERVYPEFDFSLLGLTLPQSGNQNNQNSQNNV